MTQKSVREKLYYWEDVRIFHAFPLDLPCGLTSSLYGFSVVEWFLSTVHIGVIFYVKLFIIRCLEIHIHSVILCLHLTRAILMFNVFSNCTIIWKNKSTQLLSISDTLWINYVTKLIETQVKIMFLSVWQYQKWNFELDFNSRGPPKIH